MIQQDAVAVLVASQILFQVIPEKKFGILTN